MSNSKITTITGRSRIRPPGHLSAEARAVYEAMVASAGLDHFTTTDVPLLAEYATAAATAQRAAGMLDQEGHVIGGRANPWLVVQEKAQRAMVALSARLRVCPQSRFDRLKAGTESRKPGQRGAAAIRAAYEAEQ
jgi:phage terminase small subunit